MANYVTIENRAVIQRRRDALLSILTPYPGCDFFAGQDTYGWPEPDPPWQTAQRAFVSVLASAVTVPGIVGLPNSVAQSLLTSLGLVGQGVGVPSTFQVGLVLTQSPLSPAYVYYGSIVSYTYSSVQQVPVPNVVGLASSLATTVLVNAFNAAVTTSYVVSTQALNTVVAQSIAPGTLVIPNTAVVLSISAGPGNAVMPNLVGFLLTEAEQILIQAGVVSPAQIGYFGNWPIGVTWVNQTRPSLTVDGLSAPQPFALEVIAQSVAAGQPVKTNSPITLTVVSPPFPISYPGTNLMSS